MENGMKTETPSAPAFESKNEYKLRTFQSSLNLLAHILIGIVVGSCLFFAYRNGLPLGNMAIHIVLCVLGYHLLMAESILSLSPYNGWSSHLRIVDKRRAHWILQILGSGLAIAGSIIMSRHKVTNWDSLHGKFALVALVFTTVSLVNGLASLYAYEIQKLVPLPGRLSKVTHICFGIVAFGASTISLCYGFQNNAFRNFFGQANTETLIGLSAGFTAIILINPCITFVARLIACSNIKGEL
ncbi:unnamed protein product [Arctia plantaginis]|uniref:ascorbate ferrireductase (transmembrane) n=1 Tax=Arctia plantaginis TaxID=874455 RepID=A0A8S1B089_ARCPL|nr:unnamed protein product [Arctia plantaginis]